jgi:hypothetical protein
LQQRKAMLLLHIMLHGILWELMKTVQCRSVKAFIAINAWTEQNGDILLLIAKKELLEKI